MDLNPIEVQKHLEGADYPADAESLASVAERNGAPGEIVDAIRGAGGRFDGPDDVMRKLR